MGPAKLERVMGLRMSKVGDRLSLSGSGTVYALRWSRTYWRKGVMVR